MDESHNSGIMKYLINEKDAKKFFHSSGYARETYYGNINSQKQATDTFESRRELEGNRQFIRGYKDSKVINDVRMSKAVGDAQKSQQISMTNAEKMTNSNSRRGGLGESVSGLRRGDRSGFGMSGTRGETGGKNDGGAQALGRGGIPATPSGPTTPPARRVSGISR